MKKSIVAVALVSAGAMALFSLVPPAATLATAQEAISASIPTLGPTADLEDTRATLRRQVLAMTPDPAKYPVPRTAWDGKPDFTGVYFAGVDLPQGQITARAAAEEKRRLARPEALAGAKNQADGGFGAGAECFPDFPTSGGIDDGLDAQLVSAPGYFVTFNSYKGTHRITPTDGRRPDPSAPPAFLGHSVGHWEGDTLVVETSNFKPQDIWSDALRVVERWTRPDARMFHLQVRVEDPKSLTGPWTPPLFRKLISTHRFIESFCIEDAWSERVTKEQLDAEAKRTTGSGR